MDYYSTEEVTEPRTLDVDERSRQDKIIVNMQKGLAAESSAIRRIVKRLKNMLKAPNIAKRQIMNVYNSLPAPGAAHLSQSTLLSILHRLSLVPHKAENAMLQFLNFITDMRSAGKHVPVTAWTTAISFAGRCVKRISASEIESALAIWKQMERQAGIRANDVTFNVLFDIASKARKFALADMLLREMSVRGLPMSRYTRTSIMFYYGLKGDGAGVRRSYRELIEAGEIVDTAVMSCAVASLLKAGEPVAAEQVFERAKRLHAEKGGTSPLPPHEWYKRRELGRSLARAAQEHRNNAEALKQVQDAAPLAPGVHVYKVLVYYHAVRAGDIERVSALVDEMAWYKVPVQGAIFLYLFKGFAMHGGLLYSGWTRHKLEMTFAAFVGAIGYCKSESKIIEPSNQDLVGETSSRRRQEKVSERKDDPERVSHESHIEQEAGNATQSWHERDAVEEEEDLTNRVYVSQAAAELCLSAFIRVTDATRAGEVWAHLQVLWMPTQGERDSVEAYLLRLEARKERDLLRGPLKGPRARQSHFWLR